MQSVQLKIEKLVYGGEGLARLPADERGPGKTVFMPFVLEDERVEAAPVEDRPGFIRARLEAVCEPSLFRVDPPCPYFQRCGGCHYQHSRYEHQLDIKAAIFRETLLRTGKIELPCELKIHPSPPWNYRNRTRLKARHEPEFALGYYRFRSHDLLAIDQCPISSPLINRAIREITELGRRERLPAEFLEIEFFANHADTELVLEAYCASGTPRRNARELAEKLQGVMPEVVGVAVLEETRSDEPKHLADYGTTQIMYRTDEFSYRVSAGSFFQVNRFLIDELVSAVTAGTSGGVALDLYAGVGLFALALARGFAQVIAVEASQTSYADLQHNAPQEVKTVRATTERYLGAESVRADLVVADPPRGGLGERNVRRLAAMDCGRITYVSCDPSTLARDLRTFVSLGFRIDGADFFDLFPQTYHIESVIRLAR
jgi:23S rRNA (uracil1939-C5)-methyltransferase